MISPTLARFNGDGRTRESIQVESSTFFRIRIHRNALTPDLDRASQTHERNPKDPHYVHLADHGR